MSREKTTTYYYCGYYFITQHSGPLQIGSPKRKPKANPLCSQTTTWSPPTKAQLKPNKSCYVNWSKTAATVLQLPPPFNCNFLTTSPPHSHFKAIPRSIPAHSHIVPRSLPDHSQVTPRFWAITSSFLVHSWFTPRSVPGQSKFVPRSFPTYSQIFSTHFKDVCTDLSSTVVTVILWLTLYPGHISTSKS